MCNYASREPGPCGEKGVTPENVKKDSESASRNSSEGHRSADPERRGGWEQAEERGAGNFLPGASKRLKTLIG